MKIASHILAYNVTKFIKPVIENMYPYVDRIYIIYSEKPFAYNKEYREKATNPTSLEYIKDICNGKDKVEIIIGEWDTEEDMRNVCLRRARKEGYDWLLIQDADEFYPSKTWQKILATLEEDNENELIITTWYNFWKTPDYVIQNNKGSIKETNAGFAVKCSSYISFISKRKTNAENVKIIDAPCYHYGYILSDKEILEKIKTWGHANDLFSKKWYKLKWLYWDTKTKYLNLVDPNKWEKAIVFPYKQPHFASYFYDKDFKINKKRLLIKIENYIYDIKVFFHILTKITKKIIKQILRK